MADGAEDDSVVVPVGVELDQYALADLGQGQEAGVGMGAGGMRRGWQPDMSGVLPAPVGRQRVQPDTPDEGEATVTSLEPLGCRLR